MGLSRWFLEMCGIVGIVSTDCGSVDPKSLKRMLHRVAHRGPDEEGVFFGNGIGLGHRRLSIIDLHTGRQPIGNEDGSVQVVFNGEIYNFLDLRRGLEQRGHRFSTRTDTEVLVHLYEEKGEGLLHDLNGMFAFALWDEGRGKLLLARDRIGIKPLYYASDGERLAFSSEPKALLELPWVERGLDLQGLSLFLSYDFIPAPHSIYRGIRKVPPGYFLVFKAGEVRLQRYWDLDLRDRLPEGLTEGELSDLLWGEFCRAVKMRLMSDVPLGVLLSGGIDSSSVVAALRHEGVEDLKTFSVGFQDPSFDESPYFRQVARLFRTDHHEEIFSPKDLLDILPEVASILDEPLADASIMPTYLLSRFTRCHVKVVLGGDGGDELFAGYPTYQACKIAKLYERLPPLLRRPIEAAVAKLPVSFRDMSLDFRANKFIQGIRFKDPIVRHYVWLGSFSSDEKAELLNPEVQKALEGFDAYSVLKDHLSGKEDFDELEKLLYLDTKLYLQEGVLVKVDRASMAHGLEVRVPFLDHRFVELVAGLPAHLKLRGLTTKYIWKKTVAKRLPPQVVKRRKKGFGMPVARWLAEDLRGLLLELLSEDRLKRQGIFDPEKVKRLVEEHLARRVDNRKKLWNLLIFQLWWENFGAKL